MEYYPRKIEENLEGWLNRKEIIVIKGPRQSGKTTLLLHLKERFGGNYITLEDEEMLNAFENNPKEFVKRFLNEERSFLFIDEAQYCKKAGKILKLLFDLYSNKLKLIVTGSGSFDIKVEIGKYLVGRLIYFELFPLDFEEFLLWKAKDLHKIFRDYKKSVMDFIFNKEEGIEITPVFEKEFCSLLHEYLTFGGFPAVVKENNEEIKKELLKNLVRTYIEKDIFFFFNLRYMEKFRKLLSYLSFNIGSLLEISSLIQDIKIDYKTADKYLNVLSSTYVIYLLPPFHRNLATELKKSKKIYFNDIGLRNSVLNNFSPLDNRTDKGNILENFIFNELRSFGRINYWRTTGKAEVDFILKHNNEIIPVEVKTKGKLGRSFLSFLKNYKPERALVFTERKYGVERKDKTKIAFVPHFFV